MYKSKNMCILFGHYFWNMYALSIKRVNVVNNHSNISFQVFFYLMEQIEFPYKECELGNRIADVQLIEQLKIDNCHLDLDICGTAEKSFLVKEREQDKALRYTVYFSDECILAPMAYFHTELLELTRTVNSKGIKFMGVNVGDAEDPHDHIYLSETSRKYTKVSEVYTYIS